jgi:hypothetical protein
MINLAKIGEPNKPKPYYSYKHDDEKMAAGRPFCAGGWCSERQRQQQLPSI